MTRNQWLFITLGVLLLGGGGYGACALSTSTEGESAELGMSPDDVPGTVDPGGNPVVDMPDTGPRFGDVPVPGEEVPTNAQHPAIEAGNAGASACSENQPCGAGERCCYPVGTCVPANCADCCEALIAPPVEGARVIPEGPPPPPE